MSNLENKNPATKEFAEQLEINYNMSQIKNKIIVLSGKGGVGKSSVAVNTAVGLALEGYQVGLVDIDIHGPSVPKMLGLMNCEPKVVNNQVEPIKYSDNLKVMSISFMMENPEDPIVWRGPLKMNVIKQFLHDVNWGDLDYLVVDSPPGTGDEPLSICQLIENPQGAIIVTTPQDVALNDVKKSIKFCSMIKCPVIGVVENMSTFICPHCNQSTDIFKSGGGDRMAKEMNVPFLGSIPLDLNIVLSGDDSKPFVHFNPDSESTRSFKQILEKVIDYK
ncbi:MAG: P-loop NTPase [Vampirovibrionia bacterium]